MIPQRQVTHDQIATTYTRTQSMLNHHHHFTLYTHTHAVPVKQFTTENGYQMLTLCNVCILLLH